MTAVLDASVLIAITADQELARGGQGIATCEIEVIR